MSDSDPYISLYLEMESGYTSEPRAWQITYDLEKRLNKMLVQSAARFWLLIAYLWFKCPPELVDIVAEYGLDCWRVGYGPSEEEDEVLWFHPFGSLRYMAEREEVTDSKKWPCDCRQCSRKRKWVPKAH